MFEINSRRFLARSISESISLFDCIYPVSEGLRIFMYHAVGTNALGDTSGIFSISPALFKSHMELLSQWNKGCVVDLNRNSLKAKGYQISISFDDGYQDNLDIAAPVLSDLKLPFTVFVTSSFVREEKKGFLSPAGLRMLSSMKGVTIGAHGANHLALANCDDEKLKDELLSSKYYLEDVIGKEINTVAYPYGSANRRVRNAALAAGYQLGACSHAGINLPMRDPLLLTRTEVVSSDTLRIFKQKLCGSWDWYRWRTKDPACH